MDILSYAIGKKAGGGGSQPTGTVQIDTNGIHNVTSYATAEVDVPNSYAEGDEGKVVSNGALVAQTARASEITENGTYDTTTNDEVTVNVSGSGSDDIFNPDPTIVSQIYDGNIGTFQFISSGYYLVYGVCDGSSESTMSYSVTGAEVIKYIENKSVTGGYSASFVGLIVSASAGDSVTFSCTSLSRSKMNVTNLTSRVSNFTELTLRLGKDTAIQSESFTRTSDVLACVAGTTGDNSISVVVTSDSEAKYYTENTSRLQKIAMYDDCQSVTASATATRYASNYVMVFGFDKGA